MSDAEHTTSRRVTAGVVATASLLTLAGVASGAWFTDQKSASSDLAFGTVKIAVGSAALEVPAENLAPGDNLLAPVKVSNDGSLSLRYSLKATAKNAAAAAMGLTVKTGVTSCDAKDVKAFDASGTVLYTGPMGAVGGAAVFGDAKSGQQTGDRVLAATKGEDLCVRISLPLETKDASQGDKASVLFEFNAEQTANND